MGRKENILKSFRMMGYEIDEFNGMTRVMLRNRTGFMCVIQLIPNDFELDFIVEQTVCRFNEMIKDNMGARLNA